MDWKGLIALHWWAPRGTLTLRLVVGHAHCWLCQGGQLMSTLPVQTVKVSFLHRALARRSAAQVPSVLQLNRCCP